MTKRRPEPLPPPTVQERAEAVRSALALHTAIADPITVGTVQVMHLEGSCPRRGFWLTTGKNLPGFLREDSQLCRSYSHTSLPGWQYARSEIVPELILGLELLAERGVWPTQATRAA